MQVGDSILITGARTTDKYGSIQLTVNDVNGKIIPSTPGSMKKPTSVLKSDLISDLDKIENSKEILNLLERTGTFVDLDHDELFEKMTF